MEKPPQVDHSEVGGAWGDGGQGVSGRVLLGGGRASWTFGFLAGRIRLPNGEPVSRRRFGIKGIVLWAGGPVSFQG